jgi:hypothetical protein
LCVNPLGFDQSWADGVDANLVRAQFFGENSRNCIDGSLGRTLSYSRSVRCSRMRLVPALTKLIAEVSHSAQPKRRGPLARQRQPSRLHRQRLHNA